MDGVERRLALVERAIRQLRWATSNAHRMRAGLFPNNADPLYTALRLANEEMTLAMADLISVRLELQDLQQKESTP